MASKTFTVPFADSGDKAAIPDPTQVGGEVSYTEGFTLDYELDQVTEPTAKDVPRQETNQLYFDITEFLQEIQQNGLSIYNATYDYAVGAHTIGSDGILYRALLVNGPASVVRDPVSDASGTWLSNRGDIRGYVGTFDFEPGDVAKGSDDILYVCTLANGPSSSVVGPVGDTTGRWRSLRADLIDYSATFDYALRDYAKGTDGLLYRAAIVNGPSTSVVNPVGDVTGTWILMSTPVAPLTTTVFTASDPTWAPTAGVKALKVIVTGGGGGGGGAVGTDANVACGVSGSAAGTGIKTVNAPIAASYAVVVGSGGIGGAGVTGSDGGDGGDSSFDGIGISIITGSGGNGGDGDPTPTTGIDGSLGETGGAASNGDLNIGGGDSGRMQIISGEVVHNSRSGSSYWGGGGAITTGVSTAADGSPGVAYGSGGAGALTTAVSDHDGGDGAEGIVVVEEYF